MKVALNILVFGILFALGNKGRKENRPDMFHIFAVLYILASVAVLIIFNGSHFSLQPDEQLSLASKCYFGYVVVSIIQGIYYNRRKFTGKDVAK